MLKSIIINTTNQCNLSCSYCYYSHEMKKNPLSMNKKVLQKVISDIGNDPSDDYLLILHGGEPLIHKIDYFKYFIKLINIHLKGKTIYSSIQTNGTLLSLDFIKLLKTSNKSISFSIGVSLDGPEELHNSARKYSNGTGSFKQVIKGINLLEEYSIKYGILSVANEKVLANPSLYYSFLNSLKNLTVVDVLPLHKIITGKNVSIGYGKFMETLFKLWINDNKSNFKILFFTIVIERMLNINVTGKCTFNSNCFSSGISISINPNGDITPCDNYTDEVIGNILSNEFPISYYFSNSLVRKKLSKQFDTQKSKCNFCKWNYICNGGCPINFENQKNYYCDDYKNIFIIIESYLQAKEIITNNEISISKIKSIANPGMKKHLLNIFNTLGKWDKKKGEKNEKRKENT